MTRLIDADALKYKQQVMYKKGDSDEVWAEWFTTATEIADAPTIDAEPIVRCKDCKFHGVEESMGEQKPKLYLHYCEDTNRIVEPTDFCSFAERKDNEID